MKHLPSVVVSGVALLSIVAAAQEAPKMLVRPDVNPDQNAIRLEGIHAPPVVGDSFGHGLNGLVPPPAPSLGGNHKQPGSDQMGPGFASPSEGSGQGPAGSAPGGSSAGSSGPAIGPGFVASDQTVENLRATIEAQKSEIVLLKQKVQLLEALLNKDNSGKK